MSVLDEYTLMQEFPFAEEFVLKRGYRNLDRQPVLVLTPSAEAPSSANLERLKHEYSLREELDAKWAATAIDLVHDKHSANLVLVDPGGIFLDQLLGQPMPIIDFLRLAIGMCKVLAQLHHQGIVHKDIKPSQFLIDIETGRTHLLGFGIASRIPREKTVLTPMKVISGSFPYMAPEQTGRINRSIDARSDLYALGVTLYQMLTGVLPFHGADAMEWVHCHVARLATAPFEKVPGVPLQLSQMVMKLLAKTAEERYQTASGVEADLLQCQEQWKRRGEIDSFVLAGRDFSGRLCITEKLYGREQQRQVLANAVQRVLGGGRPELILISGYSGIGKTALVNEVHQSFAHPYALFARGKFDQFHRDIPYATLAQAFQALVRQILSQSEERLENWRQAILQAVGVNGQLIIDVIPELKIIIGPQPALVELGAAEAQNRFQMVFRQFLATFANSDHALILFLDDLQWIDAASLGLIEHLLCHSAVRNLLLVGAYRNNEVGPAHPLRVTTEAIKKSDANVHEISLEPLSQEHIADLVSDTLNCDETESATLAELVYNKTAGNPYFTIQFLNRLAEEQLLTFDYNLVRWRWDIQGIKNKGFSDNVIDLMIYRLQRLPNTTLEALKQFACFGNNAHASIIAMVCEVSEEEVHRQFSPVVRMGLLERKGDDYQFAHDRVQEAAYSLLHVNLLPTLHIKIARLLLAEMDKSGQDEELFSIVNHFNFAKDLLASVAERQRLCELNIMAGYKAKAAIAFSSARRYLLQAVALSEMNKLGSEEPHAFELYLALAECEYLTGDFTVADELFKVAFDYAKSNLDRAKAAISYSAFCHATGDILHALDVSLDALTLFGLVFPESDEEIALALNRERDKFTQQLQGRDIHTLRDLAMTQDAEISMSLEIMANAIVPCFILKIQLLPLLMLTGVNLSLQHGNAAASSMMYSGYALRLAADEKLALAYEFSELALYLNEQCNDRKRRGMLLYNHAIFFHLWSKPIASCQAVIEKAFLAAQDSGDIVVASYSAFGVPLVCFQRNESLLETQKACQTYISFAQQYKNDVLLQAIRLLEQCVLCLMGQTKSENGFDDQSFSESDTLVLFERTNFNIGFVEYYILKQVVNFLFGKYQHAFEAAQQLARMLDLFKANFFEANYFFFHALTLTALYSDANEQKQQEISFALPEFIAKLKFWAASCPENFQNQYLLVQAEVARIEGRALDAMALYDDGIQAANEHGYTLYEGIGNELAANHFVALGRKTIAIVYFRRARTCYKRWGAMGKVAQLDKRFPELDIRLGDRRNQEGGTRLEHLDLLTVIKASHAVSGDIVLDHLIDELLTIVVEHAGANRGVLMLYESGQMRIAAEARTDGKQVELVSAPVASDNALPKMIINYVQRTKEKVLLEDASVANTFSEDPYLHRVMSKSVLCVPLVKQAKLVGIVYLENNLAPGAFTDQRIAVIELLASQAAISLENAILFDNLEREQSTIRELNASLEQRVIERTAELQYAVREQQRAMAQLIQQEKMASLGQLVASIAHEINTPIGAVKSSGKNITDALEHTLHDLAHVFEILNDVERNSFKKMIAHARVNAVRLSSREERALTKDTVQYLESLGVEDAQKKARILVQLNAQQAVPDCMPLLNHGNSHFIFETAHSIATIVNNADNINLAVDRIAKIVFALKSFSRMGHFGNMIYARLQDGMETVLVLYQNQIRQGTELVCRYEDVPPLLCFPDELIQVWTNLIHNALQAMNYRGTLNIAIRHIHNDAVVSIGDTGGGIAEDIRSRIFDPFFTTRPMGEGSGLGLDIVKKIVDKHKGRIEFTSTVGIGSTFSVCLPMSAGASNT